MLGSLPPSPADSGVSDVDSSSSGHTSNDELRARLQPTNQVSSCWRSPESPSSLYPQHFLAPYYHHQVARPHHPSAATQPRPPREYRSLSLHSRCCCSGRWRARLSLTTDERAMRPCGGRMAGRETAARVGVGRCAQQPG
ncbi:ETS- transcription factor Elf-2 [Homalodisca vitripennis]|nr:ETS- transcription factor Elf-2 [Homalodisca vitripennis]